MPHYEGDEKHRQHGYILNSSLLWSLSTLFEALITLHSRFTSCFYFSWVISYKPLSACFFPEVILVFHSDLAVRTLLAQNIGERNFIPSFSERFQVYILSLLWEYPKLFIYSIRNMTSFLENPNLDQKVQEPLSFERRHKTIAPLLQLWLRIECKILIPVQCNEVSISCVSELQDYTSHIFAINCHTVSGIWCMISNPMSNWLWQRGGRAM